jgi:hypothetical protein
MRIFLVLTALLQLAISPAMAQTPPLAASSFSIAVDSVVPADIEVHALPAEAEKLAPELRGFGYVVIEELVALVEPRTRKVEIVFPRWAR